jgi:serine/threonine protein kinase
VSLTCPPPDILRKLAFGRVPADRERELDRHLSACARCRQQHDDHFRPIVDAVRVLSVNRSARGPAVTVVAGAPPALPDVEPVSSDLGSLGKFRLLEVLGEGGMGRVYRAFDTTLKCERALKVILLRDRDRATADERRGLFAEAQAAARLDDANIVSVLEAGEIADTPYLVMPLLKGETLGGRLRRGAVPLFDLCRIGSQIARGLAAAHAAGLVHRDIKPGNIWLEPRPGGAAVRLLDFGLARPLTEVTEGMAGTPAYMAPEQAAGRAVDARADLFSVGAVLYEMASGKRLFPGAATTLPNLLAAVKAFDAPSGAKLLPTVPPRLSGLIAGLLRNDPQRRTPDDAEELADALAALAAEFDPGRRRKQVLGLLRTAAVVAASVLVVLGGLQIKKNMLDAPVDLARLPAKSIGADTNEVPPVLRPKTQSESPKQPAITAGLGLTNLDHLEREQIPPGIIQRLGDLAPQVVGVLPAAEPGVEGHAGAVLTVALHPNGRLLATGGRDGPVRLWDLAHSPPKHAQVLHGHESEVKALVFTTDGKRLTTGLDSGEIVVRSVDTLNPDRRYHTGSPVRSLAASQRGSRLAIGHADETARVLDLDADGDGTVIRGQRGFVDGLAFTHDDERLAVGSQGRCRLINLAGANKEIRDLSDLSESKVYFDAVAVSPDGTKLLANGIGNVTGQGIDKLFAGFGNNRDSVRLNALSVRALTGEPVTLKVLKHDAKVRRAAFTSDGLRVVSITYDGRVYRWNWSSETRLEKVELSPDAKGLCPLNGLVVHPDGRHAIVGDKSGSVFVIRFSEGK